MMGEMTTAKAKRTAAQIAKSVKQKATGQVTELELLHRNSRRCGIATSVMATQHLRRRF
jgi:hypothetical protein